MGRRTTELLLTVASLVFLVAIASLPDTDRTDRFYNGDFTDAVGWHEEGEAASAILIEPLSAALVAAASVDRWIALGLSVFFLFLAFTAGYVNDRRRRAGLRPLLSLRPHAEDALLDIGALALIAFAGLLATFGGWINARPLPHVDALGYLGVAVLTMFVPVRLLAPSLLRRVLPPDTRKVASQSWISRALSSSRVAVGRVRLTRRALLALGASGIGVSLWYASHYVPGAEHALVAAPAGFSGSDAVPAERRYLVNFHAHTSYSDGFYSPGSLIELMIKSGFQGSAITDHDNIGGALEAERIAKQRYPQFLVIPGVEFTTREAHLLLLGVRENFPHASYGIPEAIARVHELGGLVIAAHWRQRFATKEQLLLWGVDGFEIVNWGGGEGFMDRSVIEFCKTHRARDGGHRLIMLGDTDTHGDRRPKVANEIDSGALTVGAVLDALRDEGHRNKVIVRDWRPAGLVPEWTPMPLRELIYTMARLSPGHVIVWAFYFALTIYAGGAILRTAVFETRA
jgi:hypothetical protein